MESYLEIVFERAVAVADKHWDFVYAADKHLQWTGKSQLFLRCRKIGNGLALEWYATQWIGSKAAGTKRQLRIYIPRPKNGFAYSQAKLRSLARDWEYEQVIKTEAMMTEFRHEAHCLTRAILALRAVTKKEERT